LPVKIGLASLLSPVALVLASAATCSIYDPSLVGGGGSGGSTATSGPETTSSATAGGMGGKGSAGGASTTGMTSSSSNDGGAGGSGGMKPCSKDAECTGQATECKKPACLMGTCGFDFTAANTVLMMQTPSDCLKSVCDGMGNVKSVPDDMDLEDDKNDCTTDTCAQGIPKHDPKAAETACGNMQKCTVDAKCVDCVTDGDCASNVCDAMTFKCAPPGCGDNKKNGAETDVDCGGAMCPPCSTGQGCSMGTDCVGGVCAMMICAPSCTDGVKNNGESDVDCGGPSCPKCDVAKACGGGGDCKTGSCVAGACACSNDHLVISEVRSRGAAGAADEFIELYNPTPADVVLDATWKVDARSSTAGSYAVRWTGSGKTIPSHGHYLIANTGYVQAPNKDDPFAGAAGITDASSLRLLSGAAVIDAVCYGFSASTKAALMGVGYVCEGTPADNLPHNNTTGVGDADVSIQRLPGGALGNCIDAGDNSADFISTTPALPQSTTSPTTP
jgi:hypothetical protein